MMATLQRVVSFAYQRGLLGQHHLLKIQKRAKSNRAAIIWRQEEIDHFLANTPTYVGRVLIAASETGLRPGDLRDLTRADIEETGNGQTRIVLRTRKSSRRNYASIPVTPKLKAMIRELPAAQEHIVVGADGRPFHTANSLGALVNDWRNRVGIRKELRFYDCRGTAVTRLVRAGCNMGELAGHMGWSLEYAAQMLSRYAAIDPDVTDGILDKVLAAEIRRAGTAVRVE
jgi:integrase